ncbi:MAG TPA: nitronate monooxygenase family protein [Allocoleopsis sp.]
MKPLPSLQIGKYTARYPIVQGAMAVRVSGGNLAGAVAQAGGIGVIATLGLGLHSSFCDRYSPRRQKYQFFIANRLALIDELQKARAISPDGLIGVNVLVATKNYPDLVRTAVEQGANLIIAGAGLPLDLPEYTADYPDVALVPIVSTVSAAASICQHWKQYYHRLPDAFIAECPRSSGGLGATSEEMDESTCQVERIVPELVDYLHHQLGSPIPVIASGGIWHRADIDAMLALGASGVQIGTRFITTEECDADIRYKEFHLNASPEDIAIVPSPVGVPGRALRNKFVEKAIAHSPDLERRCIANCLQACNCRDKRETYCLIQALDRAARGDVENGLVFAGTKAGRTKRIMPVAELMAELTL